MFNLKLNIQTPLFKNGKEKKSFAKHILLSIDQEFNATVFTLGDFPLYSAISINEKNDFTIDFKKTLNPNENELVLKKSIINFLSDSLSLTIY